MYGFSFVFVIYSLTSSLLTIMIFFPERRQTMLFSATANKKIEEITRLALKKEPLYVGVDDSKDAATVEGLEQGR